MAARWRWLILGTGLLLAMAGLLGFTEAGRAARPRPAPATRLPEAVPERISGSGFLVAPGLLVTNAHVVLRCRMAGMALRLPGHAGSWRLLREDDGTDLALLAGPATTGDAVLPLSAAQRLPRGMPVMALGFPTAVADAWPAGRLRASTGQVQGAALTVHEPEGGRAVSFTMTDRQGRPVQPGWEDGLRYFGQNQANRLRWRLEIDATTAGGSSGGPVLDAAGNVVGVVYAGGGGLTSAVPLADLRDFLAAAGVVPLLRAPPGAAAPDWRAVEAQAAAATRRIGC
jgi:S1-C subfamily serine protease